MEKGLWALAVLGSLAGTVIFVLLGLAFAVMPFVLIRKVAELRRA